VSGEVWLGEFLQNTVNCQAYEEVPMHVAAIQAASVSLSTTKPKCSTSLRALRARNSAKREQLRCGYFEVRFRTKKYAVSYFLAESEAIALRPTERGRMQSDRRQKRNRKRCYLRTQSRYRLPGPEQRKRLIDEKFCRRPGVAESTQQSPRGFSLGGCSPSTSQIDTNKWRLKQPIHQLLNATLDDTARSHPGETADRNPSLSLNQSIKSVTEKTPTLF
jgi:hypothetical protein